MPPVARYPSRDAGAHRGPGGVGARQSQSRRGSVCDAFAEYSRLEPAMSEASSSSSSGDSIRDEIKAARNYVDPWDLENYVYLKRQCSDSSDPVVSLSTAGDHDSTHSDFYYVSKPRARRSREGPEVPIYEGPRRSREGPEPLYEGPRRLGPDGEKIPLFEGPRRSREGPESLYEGPRRLGPDGEKIPLYEGPPRPRPRVRRESREGPEGEKMVLYEGRARRQSREGPDVAEIEKDMALYEGPYEMAMRMEKMCLEERRPRRQSAVYSHAFPEVRVEIHEGVYGGDFIQNPYALSDLRHLDYPPVPPPLGSQRPYWQPIPPSLQVPDSPPPLYIYQNSKMSKSTLLHPRPRRISHASSLSSGDDYCSSSDTATGTPLPLLPEARIGMSTFGHMKIDYSWNWNNLDRYIAQY